MFEKDLERLQGANTKAELLKCLYEGLTLAETCAAMRLNPAALAFARKDNAELDQDIRDAQAFRCDMMVDKLENIQDYESDAHMARVMSDNIKWLASKRYREIYGDKVDVNHNVTINIAEAMEEARVRTLKIIDANPLELQHNATDNVSVEVIDVEAEPVEIDPLS